MTLTRLLIGLDFDGTLAPVQQDPTTVSIDPELAEVIRRLAAREDVTVAIVSGRDLEDLTGRTTGIEAWRSGAHGRELSMPDGEVVATMEPLEEVPGDDWFELVEREGMRVERKKFGIALHWRGVDGIDEAAHPAIERLRRWGLERELHLSPGRAVLEVARGKAEKKLVMEKLNERLDADRVIYAGDDLTDFKAIEWAAQNGMGILVRSPERPEVPRGATIVESRHELAEMLQREVEKLDEDISG